MSMPDYDARPAPGTSLFDVAAARQAELLQQADALNRQRRRAPPSRSAAQLNEHDDDDSDGDDPEASFLLSHLLTTILYSTSLSAVHLTMDILVWHQYGQEIEYPFIFHRLLYAGPTLLLLVFLAHSRTALKFGPLRQALFALLAVGAGCRLVWVGNQDAFLGVMKNSAPTGVLWIWALVEMDLPWALASLLPVAAWCWWNGFGMW